MKISKNSNQNWKNDNIQFPRLISELQAAGALTDEIIQLTCNSMDITEDELFSLVDHADKTEWVSFMATQSYHLGTYA